MNRAQLEASADQAKMKSIPETVTPDGLRERAKIVRPLLVHKDSGSCARHLELAADALARFEWKKFDLQTPRGPWLEFRLPPQHAGMIPKIAHARYFEDQSRYAKDNRPGETIGYDPWAWLTDDGHHTPLFSRFDNSYGRLMWREITTELPGD